jgi:hypothetical protein
MAFVSTLISLQVSYAQSGGAMAAYSIAAGPWISPFTGQPVGTTWTTWCSDGTVTTLSGDAKESGAEVPAQPNAVAVNFPAVAQDNGVRQLSARQQLQRIHGPRSIDEELAHLVQVLKLNWEQQQLVWLLLEEHHDRIQALLDRNPTMSRQELGPQIHAISDETHRQIHALLSDRQKVLETAMKHRQQ